MTDEVVVRYENSIVEIEDREVTVIDREVISVVSEGIQGPAGVDGGGLESLEADPTPTLGADLQLNGHAIVGMLETDEFIMDGGLLG